MEKAIVIKSNKYGLTINLNPNYTFDEIKSHLIKTFNDSKDFFKNQTLVISFVGKSITDLEEIELINEIEKVGIKVPYVIDNNKEKEEIMKRMIESKSNISNLLEKECKFYKGTLRSGQTFTSETSIIILGDVNPGAKIITNGNVIVLGVLKGSAHVGANGNENTFVAALAMNPMQIQISNYIARSDDSPKPKRKIKEDPMIAYMNNGNIYIEKITKEVFADIAI